MIDVNKIDTFLTNKLHKGINVDERIREEISSLGKVKIFYLSSLTSMDATMMLIDSLKYLTYVDDSINNIASCVIEYTDNKNKLLSSIYEGNAVIIFYELNKVIICDIKMYPSRSINNPEVEKSVRGSKDSFTENLIINIGLIRRRIKTNELMIENFIISKKSKMSVCLLYLKDMVDNKDIKLMKNKLKSVKLDSLIMSERALEESLFDKNKYILPLVRYTERPDVASINIIKGKMIILVDTSSNAIITPVSIFDHLKNVEEYKQNPIVGTFTKILRLIGILISVFLVPLFLLMSIEGGFDNGILPIFKLDGDINSNLIQVVIITTLLEIVRIAVVHTPNALISAISLLSAIVLGEVSISLGLFSPEILLVCSLATICNFASPSYELSLSNRFLSLVLIIVSSFFGVSGFLITLLLVFLYLVNIEVFSLPYLYPIVPFDEEKFFSLFYRGKSDKMK